MLSFLLYVPERTSEEISVLPCFLRKRFPCCHSEGADFLFSVGTVMDIFGKEGRNGDGGDNALANMTIRTEFSIAFSTINQSYTYNQNSCSGTAPITRSFLKISSSSIHKNCVSIFLFSSISLLSSKSLNFIIFELNL